MYNRRNFIGLETDRFIAEAENASTGFEFGSESRPLRKPLRSPSWEPKRRCEAFTLPLWAPQTTLAQHYFRNVRMPRHQRHNVSSDGDIGRGIMACADEHT